MIYQTRLVQSTLEERNWPTTGPQILSIACDNATLNYAMKDELAKLVHKITASEADGGLALTIDILVNCGGIQRR